MRFCYFSGALAAAALMATLPALGQAAPSAAAPTLTPPGSITPLPLMPNQTAAGGAPMAIGLPNDISGLPSTQINPYGTMPGNSLSGLGEGAGLSILLAGTSALPLTLTLNQLDASWRCMTITGNIDLGDETEVLSQLLGSAGIGVYYTQGKTVTIGNGTYLEAYQTNPRILNVANLMRQMQTAIATSKAPPAEALTPETPLALSLLNLQSIGSLTDIRPFNLHQQLADSQAAVKAYNSMIAALQMFNPMANMPKTPPYHPNPKKM